MSEILLQLEGVHTHIGAYHILHGVDLVVPKGQLTLLLGRNGAGKTTALRTIMGLWHASQGRVTFNGRDITAASTPDIAGQGIAYVPENMGIFSDLSVRENMLLAARQAKRASQMDEARLQWIFKLFPAVEKFWHHPAGKLSGGQKQMLAVARAIVEPRELLIVDEPSKGLAPAIINNMIDAFAQLKATGTTILLVEQNINFAQYITTGGGAVIGTGSGTGSGTGTSPKMTPRGDRPLYAYLRGRAAIMGEIPTVEELSSQLLEREIELNEKQVTAEECRGGEGRRGGSYMVILHL